MSTSDAGNVIPILMPQPDQTVEECVLARWRVRVGDRIEKGQIIFEAETSKAVFEVEAERTGRLARIVVEAGASAPVMTPVAYLAESDAALEAYLASRGASVAGESARMGAGIAAPPETTPAPNAAAAETPPAALGVVSAEVKASPAARKLAAAHGIDLRALAPGSGPEGRIVMEDVERAIAAATTGAEERRPLSPMRQAIARAVTASKQTIPHFYMKATVEAEAALALCEARKARHACGLNDLIVLACAKAVAEFPAFRSRLEGNETVTRLSANIGILVAVDDGLVAPVVRGADRLAFEALSAETRRVIAAAREGKAEGLGEGVFTISNLGMHGVEEFTAIIHPPEAAILAVGAVREQAVVRGGAVAAAKVLTLTLSCDHRLIDGVLAARFLARVKEMLENPSVVAPAASR